MPATGFLRVPQARVLGLAAAIAAVVARMPAHPAAQSTVPPAVTGPIASRGTPGDAAHEYIFQATPMDLARVGYVEEEYFISGTATRYVIPVDGKPATSPGTMPYRTRLVVRRPANAGRYRGVAVVEWQNVSSGRDLDESWAISGDFFVRAGWAWIGASVQRIGVHGADPPNPMAGIGLRQWSAARYGTLDLTNGGAVTDDSQSYDIYSQVAALLKHPQRVDPMGGLRVQRLYATGGSQSANFLVRYYNELPASAQLYDAFLVTRGGSSPKPDQRTKIFKINTEADVARQAPLRVPNSRSTHTWEITGAPHMPASFQSSDRSDFRTVGGGLGIRDLGIGLPNAQCLRPFPSPVEAWLVINAAFAALDRWVTEGSAPPATAPIETAPAPAGQPHSIVRDDRGIARGGIRLPRVAVPTALNTGENQPAGNAPENGVCGLLGTSVPFAADTLKALYPTRDGYARQVRLIVDDLVTQGVVLKEDADTLLRNADAALP